jgi:hypothetical protein
VIPAGELMRKPLSVTTAGLTTVGLTTAGLLIVGTVAMISLTTPDQSGRAATQPASLAEVVGLERYEAERARSEQMFMTTCVRKEGWKWLRVAPVQRQNNGNNNIVSVAELKANGYGLRKLLPNSDSQVDPRTDLETNYLASLSSDDRRSYQHSVTGCQRSMRESPSIRTSPEVSKTFSRISEELERTISTSDERQRADKQWSTCMLKQGLRFSSPPAITDRIVKTLQTATDHDAAIAELKTFESATLRADLSCRPIFNERVMAIRQKYTGAISSKYAAEVRQVKQFARGG